MTWDTMKKLGNSIWQHLRLLLKQIISSCKLLSGDGRVSPGPMLNNTTMRFIAFNEPAIMLYKRLIGLYKPGLVLWKRKSRLTYRIEMPVSNRCYIWNMALEPHLLKLSPIFLNLIQC